MFTIRLRSSIILMAITIPLLIWGGLPLFLMLAVISHVGMMELYRVLKLQHTLLAYVSYAAALLYYMLVYLAQTKYVMALVIGYLVVLLAVYVLTFPKFHADQVMGIFFGFFYVAVLISYIYQTRMVESGAWLVWLIFICSWGCDTMAYCTGILIGKHKMAPILSPKKSVEGAVGGVLGAMLIGVIYTLIFQSHMTIFARPVISVAILACVGSLISMIGDLAASAIKRNHEIKDYGTLIPGHGGILDRFDSVIFTAPIVYYLVLLLQNLG